MARQSTTLPQRTPVRIVFTGGGTGGHVSPILAVVDELNSRRIAFESLWVGSKHGAEREAAEEQNIHFKAVSVGKLRRYVSLRTIPDAARVPLGVVQSLPLLRRFRPHVIFSTGGYVGVPAVIAGRILGIPSLTHEQTAILGLATRINARFSHCVALSHELTPRPKIIRGGSIIVSGNPIRSWLHTGEASRARSNFKLTPDLPLLYVTGGAQGALAINDAIGETLPELLQVVQIIHQTGPNQFNGSFEKLSALRSGLPDCLRDRYHPAERIGRELADIYAATAIVVGRSGAGTVSEIAALGRPSILIPLPGVTEQLANARLLEAAGAALVIEQQDLTPQRLVDEVRRLAEDSASRSAMAAAARASSGYGDPAARIVDELLRLTGEPDWTDSR